VGIARKHDSLTLQCAQRPGGAHQDEGRSVRYDDVTGRGKGCAREFGSPPGRREMFEGYLLAATPARFKHTPREMRGSLLGAADPQAAQLELKVPYARGANPSTGLFQPRARPRTQSNTSRCR